MHKMPVRIFSNMWMFFELGSTCLKVDGYLTEKKSKLVHTER